MREAKFSHEFLGDSEFGGYTRDEDYNGFACPYFSYDQAMLILQNTYSVVISDRFIRKVAPVLLIVRVRVPLNFTSPAIAVPRD